MELDKAARLTIILAIFAGTFIGNASVGVLMYRFKNLRTVPNFLILSSCIADVLNQVFNIPGLAAAYIRDDEYFVGRPLSLAVSTFCVFGILVNLMSITLMMVDRLCAFKFNIAYRVWRTKSKAFYAIAVKWISCLVISMLLLVPIWDVDLGNVATQKYRQSYFSKRGALVASIIFPLFIINNAMIAMATCFVIKRKNKVTTKTMGQNQSILAQARKANEIKAIKTIGVTIVVFFFCYLPVTVYGILEKTGVICIPDTTWLVFLAYTSLFVPGLLNPVIYAIRTSRFRRALKTFFKDPFGSTRNISVSQLPTEPSVGDTMIFNSKNPKFPRSQVPKIPRSGLRSHEVPRSHVTKVPKIFSS